MTEIQPKQLERRDDATFPVEHRDEFMATTTWQNMAKKAWAEMKVLNADNPMVDSAAGREKQPPLPKLELAMADAPEPYKVRVTEDGRTIEIHKDGSRVERDTKSGHPLKTVDTNGNTFEYEWTEGFHLPFSKGESYLSYVSIQGPSTHGDLVEIKRKVLTDRAVDALTDPRTYISPIGVDDFGKAVGLMEKDPAYVVRVNGEESTATLTVGVGTAAGAGPLQGAAGASLPVQKQVDVSVGHNGELTIRQRGQTWNGKLAMTRLEYVHHLDGSTTQVTTSGLSPRTRETVERAPDGKKISRTVER